MEATETKLFKGLFLEKKQRICWYSEGETKCNVICVLIARFMCFVSFCNVFLFTGDFLGCSVFDLSGHQTNLKHVHFLTDIYATGLSLQLGVAPWWSLKRIDVSGTYTLSFSFFTFILPGSFVSMWCFGNENMSVRLLLQCLQAKPEPTSNDVVPCC